MNRVVHALLGRLFTVGRGLRPRRVRHRIFAAGSGVPALPLFLIAVVALTLGRSVVTAEDNPTFNTAPRIGDPAPSTEGVLANVPTDQEKDPAAAVSETDLPGRYFVTYHDSLLGEVHGVAEIFRDLTKVNVRLQNPKSDGDSILTSSSITRDGTHLTIVLEGSSPSGERAPNPQTPATLPALGVPRDTTDAIAAAPGIALRLPIAPRPLADQDRITLKLEIGADHTLVGTWSYNADPVTHRQRLGDGRAGEYATVEIEGRPQPIQYDWEVWQKTPPVIAGAILLENQVERQHPNIPSYEYPYTPDGHQGWIARQLFVYGWNLPTEVSDAQDYESDDPTLSYFTGWLRSEVRKSSHPIDDFTLGWKRLLSRAKPEDHEALRAMDALVVDVRLARGVLPGPKRFTLNGAPANWTLQFGDNLADIRFVRMVHEEKLERRGAEFVSGSEDTPHVFVYETIQVEVRTDVALPVESIPLILGHNGAVIPLEGEKYWPAIRVEGSRNTYRTPPIRLLPRAPANASDSTTANADSSPHPLVVKDGDELFARLGSADLLLVRKPNEDASRGVSAATSDPTVPKLYDAKAKVVSVPARVGGFYYEALVRAAKCRNIDVTDWTRLPQEEFNKRLDETSETLLDITIPLWRLVNRRPIDFRLRDVAAMIMLRDEFVRMMRDLQARIPRKIETEAQLRAFRKTFAPLMEDPNFPLALIKVEGPGRLDVEIPYSFLFNLAPENSAVMRAMPLKGDAAAPWRNRTINLGVTVPYALAFDEDFSSRYFVHYFGNNRAAAQKWSDNAVKEGLEKYRANVAAAIARAENAGDCDIEELVEITGLSFEPVKRSLLPKLMHLVQRGGGDFDWEPDRNARAAVEGIATLAGYVKAVEALNSLENSIALTAIGLVTLPLTFSESVLAASIMMAVDAADVTVTTITGGWEYYESKQEVAFAMGSTDLLGNDRAADALENEASAIGLAADIGLSAVGAAGSALDVASAMRRARGMAVFEAIRGKGAKGIANLSAAEARDLAHVLHELRNTAPSDLSTAMKQAQALDGELRDRGQDILAMLNAKLSGLAQPVPPIGNAIPPPTSYASADKIPPPAPRPSPPSPHAPHVATSPPPGPTPPTSNSGGISDVVSRPVDSPTTPNTPRPGPVTTNTPTPSPSPSTTPNTPRPTPTVSEPRPTPRPDPTPSPSPTTTEPRPVTTNPSPRPTTTSPQPAPSPTPTVNEPPRPPVRVEPTTPTTRPTPAPTPNPQPSPTPNTSPTTRPGPTPTSGSPDTRTSPPRTNPTPSPETRTTQPRPAPTPSESTIANPRPAPQPGPRPQPTPVDEGTLANPGRQPSDIPEWARNHDRSTFVNAAGQRVPRGEFIGQGGFARVFTEHPPGGPPSPVVKFYERRLDSPEEAFDMVRDGRNGARMLREEGVRQIEDIAFAPGAEIPWMSQRRIGYDLPPGVRAEKRWEDIRVQVGQTPKGRPIYGLPKEYVDGFLDVCDDVVKGNLFVEDLRPENCAWQLIDDASAPGGQRWTAAIHDKSRVGYIRDGRITGNSGLASFADDMRYAPHEYGMPSQDPGGMAMSSAHEAMVLTLERYGAIRWDANAGKYVDGQLPAARVRERLGDIDQYGRIRETPNVARGTPPTPPPPRRPDIATAPQPNTRVLLPNERPGGPDFPTPKLPDRYLPGGTDANTPRYPRTSLPEDMPTLRLPRTERVSEQEAWSRISAADQAQLSNVAHRPDVVRLVRSDPEGMDRLLDEFGAAPVAEALKWNAADSVEGLQAALRRARDRVDVPRPGLFESIHPARAPPEWSVRNVDFEEDGLRSITTTVEGPGVEAGQQGRATFSRIFDPENATVTFDSAFSSGANPWMRTPGGVEMVPGRGTPTTAWVTLSQMRRWEIQPGSIKQFKWSNVIHFDSVMHMGWLHRQYPDANLGDLFRQTGSFNYNNTVITQSGHVVTSIEASGADWVRVGDFVKWAPDEATGAATVARYGLKPDDLVPVGLDVVARTEPHPDLPRAINTNTPEPPRPPTFPTPPPPPPPPLPNLPNTAAPPSALSHLDDPVPREVALFVRTPDEAPKPVYLANAREAATEFGAAISGGRGGTISRGQLRDLTAEMHRIIAEGRTGRTPSRTDVEMPGRLRDQLTFEQGREKGFIRDRAEAYLARIQETMPQLDLAWRRPTELRANPLPIEGMPPTMLPRNSPGGGHAYPPAAALDEYFERGASLLREIDAMPVGSPEALDAIGRYYHLMLNAAPFPQINNSIFMTQVNHLLRAKGASAGISHGWIDHLAYQLEFEDFRKVFRAHIEGRLPPPSRFGLRL